MTLTTKLGHPFRCLVEWAVSNYRELFHFRRR